jgi:hypothetical protein
VIQVTGSQTPSSGNSSNCGKNLETVLKMTSFAPHSAFAEDQEYAKSILTFHVLRSGATMGAILAIPSAIGSTLYWGLRTLPTFYARLLIHSFRGTLGGLVFSVLALKSRMWRKDHIEWQDRTWRLLENKGQMEVDNWILEAGVLGGAAALIAARRSWLPPAVAGKTFAAVLGGVGLGAATGTAEYVIWRHGIQRGNFPERKNENH